MSGGHFDYKQYNIDDIADEIGRLIETNDSTEKDEWGDTIGRHYDADILAYFKDAVTILKLASLLVKRIDWLVSGDDGPESFKHRVVEELANYIRKE